MPFKLVLSSFAHQPYKLNTLPLILFGENPNGGLWFLYALFLIQLFTAKFANEKNLPLMIFLCPVILASLNAFTDLIGLDLYSISRAFVNAPFFILGLWFGKDFKNYMHILNNRIYIYIYVSFVVSEVLTLAGVMQLNSLCAITGILSVLIFTSRYQNRLLCLAGEYSMDIYVMHGIFMVMLRIPLWSILKINYYVCSVILFIGGVVLPVLVSHYIIRRSKLLKFLILGMR